MKKFLAYFFLTIYLLNQTAYSLPGFNSAMETYEFKKKCKYGRKDKLIKKSVIDKISLSNEKEKSDKKEITFCSSDVHIAQENYITSFNQPVVDQPSPYKMAVYCCSKDIHSPPPCNS